MKPRLPTRALAFIAMSVAFVVLTPLAVSENAMPQRAALENLRGISQAEFNQDGSRVLLRSRKGEVTLWNAADGSSISSELGAQTDATSLIASPDRKRVLLGFAEHAQVFDTTSGSAISPTLPIRMSKGLEVPAIFSPSGETLVIFGETVASIWNVEAGQRIHTIPLPPGPYEEAPPAAIFTEAGAHCFLMDPAGAVTRYETQGWKKTGQPMNHPRSDFSYSFAFSASANGKWIATWDEAGENGLKCSLKLWDATASKPLGAPLSGINGFVGYFVPGKNRVVIAAARGEGQVRDLPSMKTVYRIRRFDDLSGPPIAISPDGKWILSWDSNGAVESIEAGSGKVAGTTPSSSAGVARILIAPDSATAYILSDNPDASKEQYADNQITKRTLPDLKITGSMRALEITQSSSLSPDGRRLLILYGTPEEEQILILDTATMKPLESP